MGALENLFWAVANSLPVTWLASHLAWWGTPLGAAFLWHYKKRVDVGDKKAPIRAKLIEHLESTAERTRAMIATINRERYTSPETRSALTTAKEVELTHFGGHLTPFGRRFHDGQEEDDSPVVPAGVSAPHGRAGWHRTDARGVVA